MSRSIVVIACAVLHDEIEWLRDQCPDVVRVCELAQGLHNEPDRLRTELQAAIDAVELVWEPDAIVLVYGLCSRGTEGLHARRAKLVWPRAHDCITLLLGSKERYAEEIDKEPGTYWYSSGWNATGTQPGPDRIAFYRQHYEAAGYDEDDIEFLMEQEQSWLTKYDRAAWVDFGVDACGQGCQYTKDCASHLGWRYESIPSDPALLRDLMAGVWDEDRFLVCGPGQTAELSGDARVLRYRQRKGAHR
jgi:hypothetical protein